MTTQVVKRSEAEGNINHNEPCESCQSIGRDKTGDHLLVFADGGAYCQRCKYTRRSDGTIKNYGNLDPTDTTGSKDPEVSCETTEAMLTEAPSTSIVFGTTTTPESPASYPSDKIRSIPQDVVDLYGVRVSYDPADRSITHHYYPMRSKGDLITWKVRETNTKKFYKLSKSGKAMDFFGQELAKGKIPKTLLICEGECFHPDAEVLTEQGWVALRDYKGGAVAQAGLSNMEVQFKGPLGIVDKEFSGDLIEYTSGSYYSLTTPKHQMIRKFNGSWVKKEAGDTKGRALPVPRVAGSVDMPRLYSYREIQMAVMLSADFTFRESGDILGSFRKQRKIDRCRKILTDSGVKFTENVVSNGMTSFFIHRGHGMKWEKEFSWDMLGNSQEVISEINHWDGNCVKGRCQEEYASILYHNAVFIQTCAHLCGFTSTIMNRENAFGKWFKVSILINKETSSTQQGLKEVPYKGRVMCLTMPSGCLLVRQRGSISISGNCDAMASCEMLKRMDVLCVSLPSGANTKVIQDHLPWLQKIPKVVLAYDQDEPGEDNVAATWELLPNVLIMKFSEKDPCDMLSNLKTLEFIDAFTNADPYKPRTIIETGSLVDSLATPVPLGLSYPWDGLTGITYGIQLNTIVGLGAAPGAGKTTVVKGIQSHLMLHHGQKIGIVSLEESSELTLRAMVGYEMGKQIHIPGQAYDTAEAQRVARSLDDLCYIYDHKYYDGSWDEIESAIRYLYSTGVRYFFIDPLSALVSHLSASDANQYLSKAMFSMSKLVQALDLTVFHVNHLNSPSGKAHEEGGRVFGSAFTGSRSQYRYSNLLLGMERNQLADSESERNLMTVRIIKDRLTGGTGKSVPLKYLHSTGKLEEVKPTTSFA